MVQTSNADEEGNKDKEKAIEPCLGRHLAST